MLIEPLAFALTWRKIARFARKFRWRKIFAVRDGAGPDGHGKKTPGLEPGEFIGRSGIAGTFEKDLRGPVLRHDLADHFCDAMYRAGQNRQPRFAWDKACAGKACMMMADRCDWPRAPQAR
jgi:hypothetical protein